MTTRPVRLVLQRRPEVPATSAPFDLPLAAAVAAAAVFGTSAGDAFVAAVALVVAGGRRVGGVAGLAVLATVARWGTADLGAVAGDQAVLGPAVLTGAWVARAGSALAAAALLLVARPGRSSRPLLLPAALGLGAAALAVGPTTTSVADATLRVGASVVGVGAAIVVARRGADRGEALLAAGALAATGALVLSVVA